MLSIAACFGDDRVVRYLPPGFEARELDEFISPMRNGVLVVTHNGPRYDLPFLNGTLIKMGLEPLPPLMVSDTYAHLARRGKAFSASLGNLAQRFGVDHQKGHMSEVDWSEVFDGDPAALIRLREYNTGDVITTLELREELLRRGLLGPPRLWRP